MNYGDDEPQTCDCCLKQRPSLDFSKYKGREACNNCVDEAREIAAEMRRDVGYES